MPSAPDRTEEPPPERAAQLVQLGCDRVELNLDPVGGEIGLAGDRGDGRCVQRLVDPFAHRHAGLPGRRLDRLAGLEGHALDLPGRNLGTAGFRPFFHR